MSTDAFTAGVDLGGLNDPSAIKILVCKLLDDENRPVLSDDILEAVSGCGCANYFETADALSELGSLGHVTVLDDWYTITPSGHNIASLLSDDLPRTVYERSSARLSELVRRRINARSNRVTITERQNGGCTVHCAVCETSGEEIFSVDLDVPSRRAALTVRENFIDRAEDVMRSVLKILTGEEL